MRQRLSKQELVLVAAAILLGSILRLAFADRLAVEHFDEGVYSSTVWYSQISAEPYPARHLYAPPVLPVAIGWAAVFVGPDLAPLVPGLLAGCLSILVLWACTRAMFGMAAGLMVLPVVALSDYHILYSRMALTDVPVMMWIVLSVWLGVTGIDRQQTRLMALSGITCGIAWWTKYSGWLPLAILGSGSGFWWLLWGRKSISLSRLVWLNLVAAVSAAVVWCPWYLSLQNHGGYAAVAANHAGYLQGWNAWLDNLVAQLIWHTWMDSWLSGLAMLLGLMMAGCHRWFDARRSTWNRNAESGTGITPRLLSRFLTASVLLCVGTLSIGAIGTLVTVGLAGLAGVLLWPVLSVLREESDVVAMSKKPRGEQPSVFDVTDQRAAPDVDPRLAACIVTAWFCGMLLMTPRYTPFPRLLLPLLTSVWIATAAGCGWWIEACVSVARRTVQPESRAASSVLQLVVTGLVFVAFTGGLLVLSGQELVAPTIHDSRKGLKEATLEVVEACRNAAGGLAAEGSESQVDSEFVVYVFGEPAVLYHLSQAGVVAAPVQSLELSRASRQGRTLPTFLVFGPNALRTPRFLYNWVDIEHRYEYVKDVPWLPSQVVLYNLFSPQWLAQHPGEDSEQMLEVYRLK